MSDWISVREQPLITWSEDERSFQINVDGMILVFIPRKGPPLITSAICGTGAYLEDDDGNEIGYHIDEATHWMPLPDPPTEQAAIDAARGEDV